MLKNLKSMKLIPQIIRILIANELYRETKLIGYRKVSKYYKIRVVEFSSKKRMWFFKHEIL
uniref:Cytochrome b6-f complex subunit PetP n=1 Tax=Lophosiphonia teges TaxID=2007110 RepID=A0A1Z1MV04_9FLOR|nr:cytochrome b6-f complex subunit PetP [Polysiphonia teges]